MRNKERTQERLKICVSEWPGEPLPRWHRPQTRLRPLAGTCCTPATVCVAKASGNEAARQYHNQNQYSRDRQTTWLDMHGQLKTTRYYSCITGWKCFWLCRVEKIITADMEPVKPCSGVSAEARKFLLDSSAVAWAVVDLSPAGVAELRRDNSAVAAPGAKAVNGSPVTSQFPLSVLYGSGSCH